MLYGEIGYSIKSLVHKIKFGYEIYLSNFFSAKYKLLEVGILPIFVIE